MYVGNFLSGGFTVGEKKVHAFAPKFAAAQCGGDVLSDLHQFSNRGSIELAEVGNMMSRHDQDVPRVNGLDIHEGRTGLPSVHEYSRQLAGENLTERAHHRFTSDRLTVTVNGRRASTASRRSAAV